MTPPADAAVVVVNYGSSALLRENLAGLTGAGLRVVVVDNFTTAAERDRLAALGAAAGWEVLPLPGNPGFGAGANAGVARAGELGCTAVVLLNPDVQASPAVLQALVAHVRAAPDALVSPLIRRPDGVVWFAGAELLLDTGTTRALHGRPPTGEPWLPGTCLAVHIDLWDRLQGFDDAYFLYWEDVDLSHRCLAAGGRLDVRDDLEVVHSVGGTQGPGKSAVYYRYNCRNRMLFAVRHLPPAAVLRWLLHAPGYTRSVLLRGGRRQFVRTPSLLLAGVGGTGAGIVLAVRALLGRPVPGGARGRRPATPAP
jgi:GT2 family glycosyltransferase